MAAEAQNPNGLSLKGVRAEVISTDRHYHIILKSRVAGTYVCSHLFQNREGSLWFRLQKSPV